MSNALLDEFIYDAREHLMSASAQLLTLEKNPDSIDALNALLGTLHTIKGNSGFVDLRHLYQLLHQAENLLQIIREHMPLACPGPVIDQLFQVLDSVEAMLSRLEKGENDHLSWLEQLKSALSTLENSLDNPNASSTAAQCPAPPKRPTPEAAPVMPIARQSPPPPPPAASPSPGGLAHFKISKGDLAQQGEDFVRQIEILFRRGVAGVLVDLRDVNYLQSAELGLLIAAHRKAPTPDKLILLIDIAKQPALYKVFQVLYLDKTFRFSPDEKAATAGLFS